MTNVTMYRQILIVDDNSKIALKICFVFCNFVFWYLVRHLSHLSSDLSFILFVDLYQATPLLHGNAKVKLLLAPLD